jgi:HEAT repeat protein
MKRLQAALKVQPGEGRMAALLIGLMLCASAGSAIGGTSIDALFFARFGTEWLPYLYVALGLVTFVNLMAIAALMGRVRRERLYLLVPAVLALLLVGERVLVALNLRWFYPVLWLGKDVMNALQGLVIWGLASAVCDTRQAKRLFPLFTAGSILGSVVGASSTPLLVNVLHAENLLLVWAGALGAAFALVWALMGRAKGGSGERRRAVRRKPPGFVEEIQKGYRVVRKSPLLLWMSAAAILFSVLWFSYLLPFSRLAAEQFPDADQLAAFFAAFQSLYTVGALLASLFLANRLFARFGLMNMLLAYPGLYLIGFIALLFVPVFNVLVAARFVKLIWSQGIAETVWNASLNVISVERRDHARAFLNGVPGQAGIVIAGVILVVGERALAPQQLYWIGLVAAALCLVVIWQARRAYNGALVEALRAGQPQVFFSEEEPFGGFQRDPAAVTVARIELLNPDAAIRRIAAEILGHLSAPQAVDALVGALHDSDLEVRVAALRALARARASPALLDVAARLRDPEPVVRAHAAEALSRLTPYPQGLYAHLRPLMDDPDSSVCAHAAAALLRVADPLQGTGPNAEARDFLRYMAVMGDLEARVNALEALGEVGDVEAYELVETELGDAHAPAAVRRAAATALACFDLNPDRSVELLVCTLADKDRSVREAAARAIGKFGARAVERTTAALDYPEAEAGALSALENLPVHQSASALRAYARDQVAQARHYHDLSAHLTLKDGGDRARLLSDAVREKAVRHASRALRAVGLLGDRSAMALAMDSLKSRDAGQRANALETLEAIGEAEVVKPLLKIWEAAEPAPAPRDAGSARDHSAWLSVLQDTEAWLRACAAFAANGSADPELRSMLAQLADSDPDGLVRETAAAALAAPLTGDRAMETLATLSLMDKILFLRRVPLFADLSTSDLKQVAAIASESVCPDGETLAVQGEPGDEMYIIISGEVRVLTATEGGQEIEVARRKPGDFVGEMAIISREPRMASLAAAGDVRMLCLDQKSFESLLRERPEISLAVMRVLAARLKELSAAHSPTQMASPV